MALGTPPRESLGSAVRAVETAQDTFKLKHFGGGGNARSPYSGSPAIQGHCEERLEAVPAIRDKRATPSTEGSA